MNHLTRIRSIIGLAIGMTCSMASGLQATERPTAPRLFPDTTLAYLRVDDTRVLRDKLRLSSIGRLADDPQIKPLVSEFYGTITDSLSQMQAVIGIDLDELLSIPNGEMAIALLPTKSDPAVCMLLEAGDQMPAVEILLERLSETLEQSGAVRETKDLAGIKLIAWGDPNNQERQVGYFIDSGCVVLSSSVEQTEALAKIWTGNGIDFKPLVDNRRFAAIMSRCVGAAGERPQASFFIDPIAIVRNATRSSNGGTMVTAMLPVLGVDGIQGLGGSLIMQPEDFDSIYHMHLLLNSPRRNLMATIRPKTGKTDPEDWVEENVASYFTMNWDFKKTMAAVKKIVDSFQGEGAFQSNFIDQVSNRIGVDFEKDFLDQIDDRFSTAEVFVRPVKLNSSSRLFALHLKDPKQFTTSTLPKIYDAFKARRDNWESDTIAGHVIYVLNGNGNSESFRSPDFALTVIGDCLVASDSRRALEDAIYTMNGQNEILGDAVEYKLVRDRIKKQLGDRETSIISYQRPDESLRLFYDLAADPANKERLKEVSENNPFFKALSNSLERHKLPPFEVISKYLAPSGFFVYEDDSGIHATLFSLKRED